MIKKQGGLCLRFAMASLFKEMDMLSNLRNDIKNNAVVLSLRSFAWLRMTKTLVTAGKIVILNEAKDDKDARHCE